MATNGGSSGGFDPNDIVNWFGRGASRLVARIGWLVAGVAVLAVGATSYYQVEPEQVGLVVRFGGYVRTTYPGPHFKLPLGIERVIRVPVERQLKEEFGFHTEQAGVRTDYAHSDEDTRVSSMLTGDLNVAVVEWIVQYKIRDPYQYAFRIRNVGTTFRDMAEAAMRQVIGDHSVTEVLTVGREEIQIKARDKLQEMCDHYESGIQVLQLVLQDVDPPEPVRPSFNEVNQAIQERERAINEAWAEYSRVIPEARGKAEQVVQTAEGYATERVNRAKGNTERFLTIEAEYAKAPRVTRTRLYLETLSSVLPASGKQVLLDAELKSLVPLLRLGTTGGAAQ